MNKNILVIDDEKSIRKSFMLTLEDLPCTVDTVENGMAGLEKIKEKQYDLIFLDLKMPDINGVEVLKKIRKIDAHVNVYLITAFHKEFFADLQNARNQGYEFELLNKPLNSIQLKDIVNYILEIT